MKRIIPAAILAAAALTGCREAGTVHDKAYLRAAAVDGGKVTMSFFSDISPVEVSAGSPAEAVSAAELRLGRRIFTGFTELVILGDCEPADTLSALFTEWKLPPSCIAASGRGSILLGSPPELLEGSVRQGQEQGIIPECDIVTVLSGLLSEKKTARAPELGSGGVSGVVQF